MQDDCVSTRASVKADAVPNSCTMKMAHKNRSSCVVGSLPGHFSEAHDRLQIRAIAHRSAKGSSILIRLHSDAKAAHTSAQR
jgi:hypothetical protein